MHIKVISDIHLESEPNYALPSPVDDEILIIAGDLAPICFLEDSEDSIYRDNLIRFLDSASKEYREVIYVPGNHEYYHSEMTIADDSMKSFISYKGWDNIHYLNPGKVKIDGYTFIGTTLWTDINNEDPLSMSVNYHDMADYHCIRYNSGMLRPIHTYAYHMHHKSYIEEHIQDENVIVVTHHCPSYKSVDAKFENSPLNPFFYSDLDDLIMKHEPLMWIHGHTHCPMDYMIGKTRVYCNPKGYYNPYMYSTPENPYYNDELPIKI